MVMPFLVLFLVKERGFTKAQAGQTLALYGLAAMVASYLGGWLCDRFGPLRIMKVSLLLTGLSFLALGHMRGRLAISAMMFVLALVGEVFRPANLSALAAASEPGERARSIALMRLAVNAGMAVGPSVGGFLAFYDYGWLFVVDGATSILAAGMLHLAFPEARAVAPASSAASIAPVASGASAVSVAKAPPRSPFRDVPVMAILGLMFLLNTVTFQIVSTFPLSLRDLDGFSEAWIGLTLAVNTLIIILFEMVLVHSLARRDPLKVSGCGAVLFCGGLALLPFGTGFGYVLFTVAVWTLGEMLVFPLVTSAIADRAPEETRGAYMGMLNFSFAAAFVVAPLVGTWVYQQLGPRTLWLGCGAIGLLVGAGFQMVAVMTGARTRRGAQTRGTPRLPCPDVPGLLGSLASPSCYAGGSSCSRELAVAPVPVDERRGLLLRNVAGDHLAHVDGVRARRVARLDPAVEPGERVHQHRRAGLGARPVAEGEAVLVLHPGEAVGELRLPLSQDVHREHRLRLLEHRPGLVAVLDGDRDQRRLGRDRGERRNGEAVDPLARADGHDGDSGGEVAQRLAEFL